MLPLFLLCMYVSLVCFFVLFPFLICDYFLYFKATSQQITSCLHNFQMTKYVFIQKLFPFSYTPIFSRSL